MNIENNKRFLIYKGTGGLAHNFDGLMTAIHICEVQKRDLIIDMAQTKGFKIRFSEIFHIKGLNIKYYDTYDIINPNMLYKDKTINEVAKDPLKFNSKDLKYYLFNENISTLDKNQIDEIVVYAGYQNPKIRYNIEINNYILDKLLQEDIIKCPYISLHFRNTDKKNDINIFIKNIKYLIDLTGINTLYIASDYSETYDIISSHYPDLNIIIKTHPNKNIINLHHTSENKFEEIYNCLRDIYYISKSSYFIPSYNSGLSHMIINQIKNNSPVIPNITSSTKILPLDMCV